MLPAAEEQARRRGMSEDEIEETETRRLRDELPIAPDGETLESDGTIVDRRRHVL